MALICPINRLAGSLRAARGYPADSVLREPPRGGVEKKMSAHSNFGNVTCIIEDSETIVCNGTLYKIPEAKLTYLDTLFWVYLGIYVALVLVAGLMSGLTMGLLSLDILSLQVLKEGGDNRQKKHAGKILPIVKRHHLLLVTLLLANAAAVESMPLFLDKISDPITAICVSVTAVLLFGEVLPQALCTRFGLAIGATCVPLVYILMAILFIIAWPISKLLDVLLGKDHTTFFRRAELKALVDLHGPQETPDSEHPDNNEEKLTVDEVLIIKGALEMRDKTACTAMVPIESVFMLDIEARLDEETMNLLLQQSHSRVPIFEGDRATIVGLLLVKLLIKLDPDDAVPIRQLLETKAFRKVTIVNDTLPLYDLLNQLQTGNAHLCMVRDTTATDGSDLDNKFVGIITLEDVIEELIQEEIIDETDIFVDVHRRVQVARARLARNPSLTVQYNDVLKRCHSYNPDDPQQTSPKRRAREQALPATRTRAATSSGVLVDVDVHDDTPLLS